MNSEKKLHTGIYLFGDMATNSSCGGINGYIYTPGYTHQITLCINSKHVHQTENFDNAICFDLTVSELESMHKGIERLLNDMRKLESLAKNNLLRDEAYS